LIFWLVFIFNYIACAQNQVQRYKKKMKNATRACKNLRIVSKKGKIFTNCFQKRQKIYELFPVFATKKPPGGGYYGFVRVV